MGGRERQGGEGPGPGSRSMEEEATAMTPEEEEVLPTFTLAEFSSRGLKRKLERMRTRTRTRTRRTKGVCLPLPTLTKREIEEPGSKAVEVCRARAKVKAGRRGESSFLFPLFLLRVLLTFSSFSSSWTRAGRRWRRLAFRSQL